MTWFRNLLTPWFRNLQKSSGSPRPPPPPPPPPPPTPSGPPPRFSNLSVLSMNVVDFHPSESAPFGFDPLCSFQAEILKLKHSPDVICLQEVPSHLTDVLQGYKSSMQGELHGNMLLFKEQWVDHVRIVDVDVDAPAVIARLSIATQDEPSHEEPASLYLGSCHLAPHGGHENAQKRLEMATKLVEAIPADAPFVLAGDFNMRMAEDKVVEDLGLRDAWKETGSDDLQKYTWDSVDRRHVGGGYNDFYNGAKQFNVRFDRIYFKSGGGLLLSARDFKLFANKPLTNELHYQSDHFGMVANLGIVKEQS